MTNENKENVEEVSVITLEVLKLTKEAQQKHGLRHGDYQRYRSYCTRRIRRLRCALNFLQGSKTKFNPKTVTEELLSKNGDVRYPCIILTQAERCWAYAMQLRVDSQSEPRKKFHLRRKLRKAVEYAEELKKLVCESAVCDARSKLESQAYCAYIKGTYLFEMEKWNEAIESYSTAQTIYEKLGSALNEDEQILYVQRCEELTPNLRYCAYNIGDKSAISDLKELRRQGKTDLGNLDALIAQTRNKQAITLQEIKWLGKSVPIRQEKVKMLLSAQQESEAEIKQCNTCDEKIQIYEGTLMEIKDAIQLVKDEVKAQEASKMVETSGMTSLQYLQSYLMYLRLKTTVDRNNVMIETLREKNVKPQDMVRPYEVILQCLQEIQSLPGVTSESDVYKQVENDMMLYKAFRAYYISKALTSLNKYPQALTMAVRAQEYSTKAKSNNKEVKQLQQQIEAEMYFVHAQSILGAEATAHETTQDKPKERDARILIDRLDLYYEDENLTNEKNPTQLAHFPPSFEPVNCKPLFFDLALNHATFPDLSEEMELNKSNAAAGAGLGGLVRGWLGGWK